MKAVFVNAIAAAAVNADCELTTFGGGVSIASADMPADDATCCADIQTIQNFLLCREDTAAKAFCGIAYPTCPDGVTCMTSPSGYTSFVPGATALPMMGARCTGPAPDACLAAAATAYGANPVLSAIGDIWMASCVTNPHTTDFDTCETACPGFIDLVHASHDANICDSSTMRQCIADTSECAAALETMKTSGGWPHYNARVFEGRCTDNGSGGLCGTDVDEALWDQGGDATSATSAVMAWGVACGASPGCDVSSLDDATKTTFCESAPVWGGQCAQAMVDQLTLMNEATSTGNYAAEETELQLAFTVHAPQAVAACEVPDTTTTETPGTPAEETNTTTQTPEENDDDDDEAANDDEDSSAASLATGVALLATFSRAL